MTNPIPQHWKFKTAPIAAADFIATLKKLNTEFVSGCSIMGLMMLAAAKGTTIQVTCKGPQAKEAMDALTLLVNSKFGED